MAEWCKYNLGSVIILIVLIAIVGLIIFYLVRRKLKGKCSSGCANCALSGTCHKKQHEKSIRDEIKEGTEKSIK